MNFIELVFQVDPDGGSGSLEALLLAVALILAASIVVVLQGKDVDSQNSTEAWR
jgi:uncharacterized protein HemX